eukprot:15460808-Alexandrium_andersonii.AAC.1
MHAHALLRAHAYVHAYVPPGCACARMRMPHFLFRLGTLRHHPKPPQVSRANLTDCPALERGGSQ